MNLRTKELMLEMIVSDMSRRRKLRWLVDEAEENAIVRRQGEGRQTYEFSRYSNAELGFLTIVASERGLLMCVSYREDTQEVFFYFKYKGDKNYDVS